MSQLAFDYSVKTVEQVSDASEQTAKSSRDAYAVSKAITRIVERNYHYYGGWNVAFEQSLTAMNYALSNQEDAYLNEVRTMDKQALSATCEIFSHLLKAFCVDYDIWDYLGAVYMELGSISKHQAFGQFFTPIPVAECMASISIGDVSLAIERAKDENRRLTIHDPACGAGALLLGAKRYIVSQAGIDALRHFEFSGNDIDPVCVAMARCQLTLSNYSYMRDWLIIKTYEAQQAILDNSK